MLTLDLPPQIQNAVITQATAQGVTVNDYILHAITTALSESPKQKHIDDVMVFDNDTMKERLKGFESREQALKNGVVVPKFDTIEELRHWTRHILPTLGATA